MLWLYLFYIFQLHIVVNFDFNFYYPRTNKDIIIINQKKDLPQMKKRNHSKIFRKHFLYKCNTNAERITNTDVNTIHHKK